MRLEDIKACHVCRGLNLKPILNTPVEDIMTQETTMKDVLLCLDCDTLHFIEDGVIAYEFSVKINSGIPKRIDV